MADNLDWVHREIHKLRTKPNYTASQFELQINRFIAEKYAKKCKECKERWKTLKDTAIQQPKKGVLDDISSIFGS